MSRMRIAVLVVLSLLMAGCETFRLVDQDYRPKGRSIAVVSGLESSGNSAVAERMTIALRKFTRLQVTPYKQVAGAVPPQKIKGPYLYAYFEIEEDYGNTDVKKIQQIQRKLGVDYLYVVWAPTATVTNNKIEQLHCIGQLFAGPSSKEVGHGKFAATAGKTDCCLVPPPNDQDRSDAVDEAAERVAKEIGGKLGMSKDSSAR